MLNNGLKIWNSTLLWMQHRMAPNTLQALLEILFTQSISKALSLKISNTIWASSSLNQTWTFLPSYFYQKCQCSVISTRTRIRPPKVRHYFFYASLSLILLATTSFFCAFLKRKTSANDSISKNTSSSNIIAVV